MPGHHYPYFYRYHHCRPSRVLWFIVGAVTTTLFIGHYQMRPDGQRIGLCRRAPIQPPPSLQPHNSDAATHQGWSFGEQQQAQQWEEDKARLMALSRQAGDTMSEVSEATLDSLLNTLTSLKAKFAERRDRWEQHPTGTHKADKSPPPRFV